jgi:TP901 family phage tail tape measure protein
MFDTRRLVFIITGTDNLTPIMNAIMKKNMSIAQKMQAVGKATTKAVTLPILGAAAASVKLAVDFEASMAKVQGLVGISAKQINSWSKQILELSKTLPQSPKELSDALFLVTSAGFRGKEAMQVLTTAAKGAAAGLGDTSTVADILTSALKAYAGTGLTASKVTDTMVKGVKVGKLPVEDLAGALGQVIPVAAQVGVSFQQVVSVAASLSHVGLPVNRTMTGLRYLLTTLIKPTAQAVDIFKKLGLSAQNIRDQVGQRGLLPVLQMLKKRLPIQDFLTLVGGARGVVTALGLVGKNSSQVNHIFKEVQNSTGATNKAFLVASHTAKFQFESALSSLQATAITVGAKLLPVILRIVNAVGTLVGSFTKLSKPAQNTILILLGVAAIVGPIVSLVGNFITLTGAIGKATKAMVFFDIAANANIVGIIVIAIVALVAAIVILWTKSSAFRKFWIGLWKDVLGAIMVVWNWIKNNWPLLLAILVGPVGLAALFIIKHWKTIVNGILSATMWLYDKLKPIFHVIAIVAKDYFKVIQVAAEIAWDLVYGTLLLAWAIMKPVLKALGIAATYVFKNVIAPQAKFAWGIVYKAAQGAWIIIKPILMALLAVSKFVWGGITVFARASWTVIKGIYKAMEVVSKLVWGGIKVAARTTWNAITGFVKFAVNSVIGFFKTLISRILGFFSRIINGASKAFGWLPGLGPKLKDAANKFNTFKNGVNRALNGVNNRTVHVNVGFGGISPGHKNIGQLAAGGKVNGIGTGTSDSNLIAASTGEWVVNRKSSDMYGDNAMSAVNAGRATIAYAHGGKVGHYAAGGKVGQGISVHTDMPAQSVINAVVNKAVRALANKWAKSFIGRGSNAIVNDAMRWIGTTPYVWGGTAVPGGADCSGFAQTMYSRHGIHAPRTSEAQGAWVKRTPPIPGGLAFYNSPAGGPPPGHVAIVGRNGMVISQGGGLGPQYVPLRSMALMFTGIPPNGFRNGGMVQNLNTVNSPGGYSRGGAVSFDTGHGILRPGYTMAYNGTGRDEMLSTSGSGVTVIVQAKNVLGTKREIAKYVVDALQDYSNHGGKLPA